jgi:hypothetical protein
MRIPARSTVTRHLKYRGWTLTDCGIVWWAQYGKHRFRSRTLPQAMKAVDVYVGKGRGPWWARLEHKLQQWAETP